MVGSTMIALEWMDAFETGDADLDEQHRAIVEALRGLSTLLADRKFESALSACRELRDLLVRHAEFEESRLAALNFPRSAQHLDQHRRFRHVVSDLLRECGERCHRCSDVHCIDRLAEAIIRGELIADMDYKSFLEERGTR